MYHHFFRHSRWGSVPRPRLWRVEYVQQSLEFSALNLNDNILSCIYSTHCSQRRDTPRTHYAQERVTLFSPKSISVGSLHYYLRVSKQGTHVIHNEYGLREYIRSRVYIYVSKRSLMTFSVAACDMRTSKDFDKNWVNRYIRSKNATRKKQYSCSTHAVQVRQLYWFAARPIHCFACTRL